MAGFWQAFKDYVQPDGLSTRVGAIGPTGASGGVSLQASGMSGLGKLKRGVWVQGITGTVYVGGSGMQTGTAYKLAPTGGLPTEKFIATDDFQEVKVITDGMARYIGQ